MSVPWWAFLPLGVLVAAMAVLRLHDGRRRPRRALDETRDDDGGES
jgi:hypothetical protein